MNSSDVVIRLFKFDGGVILQILELHIVNILGKLILYFTDIRDLLLGFGLEVLKILASDELIESFNLFGEFVYIMDVPAPFVELF